jgi:hypothetical protein
MALSDTSKEVQSESCDADVSTQKVFGNGMTSLGFTFRSAMAVSTAIGSPSIGSLADAVEDIQGLKRPRGHPDGPSAPNSPEKKRPHGNVSTTHHLPPPMLVFTPAPSVNTAEVPTAGDAFGGPSRTVSKSNEKLTNAKLDSFFKIETPEAKSERQTRDFERIANERESQEFLDAHAQTLRKERARQLNQERQTRHRDNARDIKIAAGWQPHQKRVSIIIKMLYRDIKPLFRNTLLILTRHPRTKMPVPLNCHGLIVNIKRVRRRTINPRVESEQNHSNQPSVSTGSRRFSGLRSNQRQQMLVDRGDHTILCNMQNGLIQLPSSV